MANPLQLPGNPTLPPPQYHSSRCAAGVPGESGCRACVDNCPYSAMRLLDLPGGRVVHIDPGMCARCGACTGLCPTSALERAFASDQQLDDAISGQANQSAAGTLVITCPQSARWIHTTFGGTYRPPIVEVPSILILNETHFIHALGHFERVAVVGCEKCHHRSAHLLALPIDRATRLTDRADDLVYVEDDRSRDNEAALRRFVERKRSLAAPTQRDRAPVGPAGDRNGRTRRHRLRELLQYTGAVENASAHRLEDPGFGQVELIAEADCTMCGACGRACPTDALQINGGELSFSQLECVNCRLCQQACPRQIIRVQTGLSTGPGMFGRQRLVEDQLIACRGCGRPHMPRRLREHVRRLLDEVDGPLTASTDQVDLCDQCRFTGPDPRLHGAVPKSCGSTCTAARPDPVGMPTIARRSFLQSAAPVALAAMGGAKIVAGQAQEVRAQEVRGDESANDPSTAKPQRLGMVIDIQRCIGCHACTAVCKAENHVPLGVFRDWVEEHVMGAYPHATPTFLPKLCNQCDDPGCLRSCPTGAIHMRPDGIVDLNHDICIGCRACSQACPYGATFMDPVRRTADKCNFCAHRIDEGLNPACVDICPTGCRIFGDLNDPESAPSQALRNQPHQVLRPELGLGPNVKYLNLPGQLNR